MAPTLDSSDLVVALAHEGVPVRAIARAVRISSSDLRERLLEAKAAGLIVSLPGNDDWPPGPRDQRALQLSRPDPKDDAVDLTLARLFGLTPTETRLLLVMLRHGMLAKDRDNMAGNTVDVHVSHIRKRLRPYGVGVETVWGCGYRIAENHRRKIMGLVKTAEAAGMPED